MRLIKYSRWSDSYRKGKWAFYTNKYFNLYMNAYKFTGEIDYQQIDFILRKFWDTGTIACFKLANSEGSFKHPQGVAVFVPYAPNGWNIYDFPTTINLINTRGVDFIPATAQEVDVDAVIGFAQRNKKGVRFFVENIIEELVDIDVVIQLNLKAHKMPFMIESDSITEKKIRALYDKIVADDPEIFVQSDDANAFKVLLTGAPYIIDKLSAYHDKKESELREFLGLDNLGVGEKKEHLITTEVESNDEVISQSEGCFIDSMKEFFDRIKEVLGISIQVEANKKESAEYQDESEQEEEIEDEENE